MKKEEHEKYVGGKNMDTRKIISVILSLCMILSVLSIGAVSASAISGGWEFSDISADNVTAEEQEKFDKALEGFEGVDYTAKDVIASQSAAMFNYAYLCIATPVTPEAIPYWAVVTVREDLDNNFSINSIKEIDPLDVKVTDNTPICEPGSWGTSKSENAAPIPDSVKNAIDTTCGVDYSAIAVLGTQIVAGKNYRILAYGTVETELPETNLYVIDVYVDTNDNAEVTSVSVFDLDAYVSSSPSNEERTDESSDDGNVVIAGGWSFSDISAENITEEEQAVFNKAMEDFGGVDYEAKDVIATQVVAGRNYAFLCIGTGVYPGAKPHWSIVTIYSDLQGNAEVTNAVEIDPSNVKTIESIPEKGTGGAWDSVSKEDTAPLPDAVQEALDMNTGLDLSSIAILGTQVVAGMNYRILAYGNLITANPRTDLYVVDVYENLDGEAEITSIASFDLLAYVNKAVVDPGDESEDESVDESAEDDESSVPDASANDSTPSESSAPINTPVTGNDNTVAIAVIFMLLAGATAASACAMRKKQR